MGGSASRHSKGGEGRGAGVPRAVEAHEAALKAVADTLVDDARQYLRAAGVPVPQVTPVAGLVPDSRWGIDLQRQLVLERALIEANDRQDGRRFGQLAHSLLGPPIFRVFVQTAEGFRFAGAVATPEGARRLAGRYLAEPLPTPVPADLQRPASYAFIDGAS